MKKWLELILNRNIFGWFNCRDETYSLMIHKTNVEDLGLSSLREIKNGIMYIADNLKLTRLGLVSLETVRGAGSKKTAIYIANNPRLCYVHNFNFSGLFDPSKQVLIRSNAPKQECGNFHLHCLRSERLMFNCQLCFVVDVHMCLFSECGILRI